MWSENLYYSQYPFGMLMPGRSALPHDYRFGFNGKENDNEVKGEGNSLDFDARIYDSRLGKWFSVDPEQKIYPDWSGYNFVRDNPILRIDPTGKWDIEIHLSDKRGTMGYGIAILKNCNGEEVYRFVVRAQGMAHKENNKNPRNRLKRYADMPTGVYRFEQWRSDGSDEIYGPNPRLDMIGISGEILTSNRTEIQIHGGRQVGYAVPKLWNTGGCARTWDNSIAALKTQSNNLEINNPEELQHREINVQNDLVLYNQKYYIPDDYASLVNAENALKALKNEYYKNANTYTTEESNEMGRKVVEAQEKVSGAENKGISTNGQ